MSASRWSESSSALSRYWSASLFRSRRLFASGHHILPGAEQWTPRRFRASWRAECRGPARTKPVLRRVCCVRAASAPFRRAPPPRVPPRSRPPPAAGSRPSVVSASVMILIPLPLFPRSISAQSCADFALQNPFHALREMTSSTGWLFSIRAAHCKPVLNYRLTKCRRYGLIGSDKTIPGRGQYEQFTDKNRAETGLYRA